MPPTPNPRRNIRGPLALSVDLGNGYTKFSQTPISSGLDFEFSSFPSFASREGGDTSIEATSGLKKLDVVTVEVDGLGYRVGPDAINAASSEASRTMTDSFYTSSEYLALFRGALAYMDLPDGSESISMLGYGLPLTVFSDRALKEEVVASIRGAHPVPRLDGTGSREITVQRVALQPQLAGSLIAMAMEHDLMESVSTGTNLTIDVGYGTLLWLVTNGLKPQVNRSGGNKGGVSSLLKAWVSSLNSKIASNPHIQSRLDDALVRRDSTIRIDGKEVSIADHAPAMQDQVRLNLRDLEASVGNLASIDNIFLVGGGAHLYRDAVQRLCRDRHVYLTKRNPQVTNLTGFQVLAQSTLGGQSAA